MIKLLRADLARMMRSKIFWICAGCAFLISSALADNMHSYRDEGLIGCFKYSVLIAAVFAALFLGTEYSDHTIRNKLIVGAKRTGIYLSNLFTVTIGGLAIAASGEGATLLVNRVIHHGRSMDMNDVCFGLIACAGAVLAACAFFTLMSMLITNKASCMVWSLFISVLALFGSSYLSMRLAETEMYCGSHLNEEGTGYTETGYYKNDYYVGGAKRVVYAAVNNSIAFGAIERARDLDNSVTLTLPLYSVGAAAVTTAIGAAVFRRKDIK